MFSLKIPTIRVAFFWVSQLVLTITIWNLLPTDLTRALLLLTLFISFLSTINNSFELPKLVNISLIFCALFFWSDGGYISRFTATVLTFIALGLNEGFAKHEADQISKDIPIIFREVAIIAYAGAQISSLIAYWPVGFFYKVTLALVMYYFFTQLFKYIESNRKIAFSHFVFTTLAVILIMSSMLWSGSIVSRIF